MFQSGLFSVVESKTRDEFKSRVVRFAEELGFDRVSAMTVVDQPNGALEYVTLDNAPAAYMEAFKDTSYSKMDPVMRHMKENIVPIVWDQDTYVSQELGWKWELQAEHGYRTGIALALHLPEGRHFALGVVRDKPLPKDPGLLTRLMADVQLFAVYAQDAAFRLLVPPALQLERPKLTPREAEALKWTMEGKTAWEVGAILGISERTAVLHINNAMHKLGCVKKHQAVLKALKLGLIA